VLLYQWMSFSLAPYTSTLKMDVAVFSEILLNIYHTLGDSNFIHHALDPNGFVHWNHISPVLQLFPVKKILLVAR
jgi:hypothetical protein